MRTKRLYITRPRMDAFLCDIKAVCLCSGVNIKLEITAAKKRSPFPTLVDLRKFLGNCSLSAAPNMQTLFGTNLSLKHQDGRWTRSEVANRKRIETVILNESEMEKLLKDIEDFLDQTSQRWYSNRDIPYRRGYLLR